MLRAALMGVVVWATGCESEPPRCETEQIQTCTSQLEIRFRDGRTGPFELEVMDDNGLDVSISCPDETEGPDEQDGYSWFCGAGSVLITTDSSSFAGEITIGVGALLPETFTVVQTVGQDACANPCSVGSVEI